MSDETKSVTLRIPASLKGKIRREAFDRDTNMSAIVTEILQNHYAAVDADDEE